MTRRSSGSPGDKVLLQSGFLGGGGTGLLVREVRVGVEVGRVGGADDTTAPGTVWRHHLDPNITLCQVMELMFLA